MICHRTQLPFHGRSQRQLQTLAQPLLIFATVLIISGCSTLSYYSGIIQGHFEIISQQQSIDELLDDPTTSDQLRQKLALAKAARQFAASNLYLPDNDSYKTYVDIGRNRVTWNVVAVPALSLSAKTWCYPIAGCVSYKGYYSNEAAKSYEKQLADENYDTTINGSAAYSTLGWFDDPVLNTMLQWREAHLIGVIFHELAHQQLYIKDDSTFNESFASFVQQEGVRRWYLAKGKPQAITKEAAHGKRKKQFLSLLKTTRDKLEILYNSKLADKQKHEQKRVYFTELRQQYISLKAGEWKGYSGYDHWFDRDLNNANLVSVSTYHQHLPGFKALLQQSNEDLRVFYAAAEKLSQLPAKERSEKLLEMAAPKLAIRAVNSYQ